jgi:hypothetical protein
MVNGRSDEGETKGDVDAIREMQQFKRNQALIMVHADHGIEFAARGSIKDGIRRVWAAYALPAHGRGLSKAE